MTRRTRADDLRALEALTLEACNEELPAIDWARVEKGLFERIEQEGHGPASGTVAPRVSGSKPSLLVVRGFEVGLAAAAVAVLLTSQAAPSRGRTSASEDGPLASPESRPPDTPTDLSFYRIPGVADLEPSNESAFELIGASTSVQERRPATVRLTRGSIYANVVSKQEYETFAIEIGRTRVAAHGTSFLVALQDDRVVVKVDHGVVAVGPSGRSATEGWLVVAPERASFSLDGARDARWFAGDDTRDPPAARPATQAPDEPSPQADVDADGAMPGAGLTNDRESPATANRPGPDHAGGRERANRRGLGANAVGHESAPSSDAQSNTPTPQAHAAIRSVLHEVRACYQRQLSVARVVFSVHTTFTATLTVDGTLQHGVFWPPLSPTLMACATEALQRVHFGRSGARSVLSVPVDLVPGDGE